MAQTARAWIHGPLPGMNDLIAARMIKSAKKTVNGKRWNAYSDLKREWERAIGLQLKTQMQPITARAFFSYTWVEPNRRRDMSNISSGGRKLVEDAMQAAGLLPLGDGWKGISGFSDAFEINRDRQGVGLVITYKEE